MRICIFDPAIEDNNNSPSANLGDFIIQESINRELNDIFGAKDILRISTHIFPKQEHIRLACSCPLIFAGGTNLLGSKMYSYKQWKISLMQKIQLKKAILLGVGWERYQEPPDWYSKLSLKALLANNFFHSVRDNYTKLQLQSAGFTKVLNTGCPTMWPLANMRFEDIPSTQAENVLVMLTDYSKNIKQDNKLLELVFSKYKKVFFWPQGRDDREYIYELISNLSVSSSVVMLEHSLAAFDNFLKSEIPFDYIGTRLHGGVKCILAKKRSLILEIDNRAKEIARDTKLPTSPREDFDYISQWINKPTITNIKVNLDSINAWKQQFKQD